MITPDEQILICAVRYALGRMSYVVSDVIEYVHYKRQRLSPECRRIIIRDIQEEVDRYHAAGETLGMRIDENQWLKLADELKEVDDE